MSDLKRVGDFFSAAGQDLEYLKVELAVTARRNNDQIRQCSGLTMRVPQQRDAVWTTVPRWAGHLIAKRVLDIVISAIALVVLLPMFAVVSLLLVLESPGPVLFRQKREGVGGRPFMALKFRSMRADECDISGVHQTQNGDSRLTTLGRFIRRKSIDELPQLLNVLCGDMSLVGPRPHVSGMLAAGVLYREIVPYYDVRLSVLPGLTGWAQANGLRGPTDDADLALARVDHDIAYIQNFSIWLDIRIIYMTICREFLSGSGT